MLHPVQPFRPIFQELADLGPAGVLMYASESRFILFLEEWLRVLFLLVALGFVTKDGVFFGGEVTWFAFGSEHGVGQLFYYVLQCRGDSIQGQGVTGMEGISLVGLLVQLGSDGCKQFVYFVEVFGVLVVEVVHQFLQVLVLLYAEPLVLDTQTHQDAHEAAHEDLELVALLGGPLSIFQGLPVLAEELASVLIDAGLNRGRGYLFVVGDDAFDLMGGIQIRVLLTLIQFFLHQVQGIEEDIREVAADFLLIYDRQRGTAGVQAAESKSREYVSYPKGEDVDGRANPSILLIEPIIQSILLPLHFLREIIVLPEQGNEISLKLEQFNHQGHHFEIDTLHDDLIGIGYFPEGDVDVDDLLRAQFGADEFDHVEVFFVDGEDAASVDVAADWMQCYDLPSDAQLPLTLAALLARGRSGLVAVLVQSLDLAGKKFCVEDFGRRQGLPKCLGIIVGHSLRVYPECLLEPDEGFFFLEVRPIEEGVEVLIEHPLRLFMEGDLEGAEGLPDLLLEQTVALGSAGIASLDQILQLPPGGGLGGLDLALAPADVIAFVTQRVGVLGFDWVCELLEEGEHGRCGGRSGQGGEGGWFCGVCAATEVEGEVETGQ